MIDDQLLQQAIELATSRDQLQRRNERERNRVNRVNIAFENLRNHLPSSERVKRLSKVETLRAAINYIAFLDQLLK